MSEAAVTATDADGVRVVRLTNPKGRNCIGVPFCEDLYAAVGDLGTVGAVAILATSEHFSVGGDVRSMAAAEDTPAFVRTIADGLHRSMKALRAGPPVVVGVRGWAAGAGMSMVAAADVTVAGESAMLRPAYPGIGVTPDGGMSYDLPRLVGERRARSLILRNVALTAAEAAELGIVDLVVPDETIDDRALELARELAAGPREAHLGIKALIAGGAHRSYAEQLDAEADSIVERSGSADGREGITAFAERRTPKFG